MATMIGRPNGIRKKKRKYGIGSLLLACGVLMFLYLRTQLPQELVYISTFIMVICILSLGYYIVKMVMYFPYKDGKIEDYELMTSLKDGIGIYPGVLLNNAKRRFFFQYIILSKDQLYFISTALKDQQDVAETSDFINWLCTGRNFRQMPALITTEEGLEDVLEELKAQEDRPLLPEQIRTLDVLKLISI